MVDHIESFSIIGEWELCDKIRSLKNTIPSDEPREDMLSTSRFEFALTICIIPRLLVILPRYREESRQ